MADSSEKVSFRVDMQCSSLRAEAFLVFDKGSQPTLGQQITDMRPTVGRHLAEDNRKIGKRQSADSWPTVLHFFRKLFTGIWFDSSGILGASTDGKVDDETLLGAKCPYTEQNLTIEESLNSTSFCLEKIESGQGYTLRKDHVYWDQVQGQMYLSCRKLCVFVV